MSTTQAFLAPVVVPRVPVSRRPKPYASPRCNVGDGDSSRRIFLKHAVHSAATVFLSIIPGSSIAAEGDFVTAPSRAKPRKVTWGYAAENGPEKWGLLSEDWALCATGQSQSPIAISYREAISAGDRPRPTLSTNPAKFALRAREAAPGAANRSLIAEQYIPGPPPIVGDAPPVDVYKPPPPGALVTIADVGTYTIRSFHFHVDSSEHVLEGNRGPLEAHFVFERRAGPSLSNSSSSSSSSSSAPTTEGGVSGTVISPAPAEASDAPQLLVLAVLGLMGEKSDPWLEEIVDKIAVITAEDARPAGVVIDVDLGTVLPDFEHVAMYTYPGSLTIPPGTEGVYWIVVGNRMQVGEKEVKMLMDLQGGANVRPLQPLNGRKVFRFAAVDVERKTE